MLIITLLIPLALSSFTHIWNPIGFPSFHVDEGHYMRRAMQVMDGLGPQESKETYDYGYDHPFFGQIFLAASLSLVNFPDSLHPAVNLHSIEMLYLVPRILMGILAVVDTFLVYKIAETKYNRKIAFISATLFAVMPLSRILRGIFLDSIELPFILLSILFAVYYAKIEAKDNTRYSSEGKIILILLSGIFLGLAIFTKMPAITLIPLVAYVILRKEKEPIRKILTNSTLRRLVVWIIPVTLIPMMWPAYAMSVGQLGQWLDGVIYQTEREGTRDLSYSLMVVSQIDPVLLAFGLGSLVYAALKRDYFILLWALPYLLFLYLIGWVVYFHWSILLPLLCIGAAAVVEGIRNTIGSRRYIGLIPYLAVCGIAIFGFASFVILSQSNLNSVYNQVYLFVTLELHNNNTLEKQDGVVADETTTLIGSHRTRALLWIPMYVFNDKVIFRDTDIPHDNFTIPVNTKKFLLVADSNLLSRLTEAKQFEKYARITKLYYNTSDTIATFIDKEGNKYNFMNLRENYGFGPFVEVRANY